MDVSSWRDTARSAGYDKMVIHDRDDGDALEVGNFLSVYRRDESWARWCFARKGPVIIGWCCLTGADIGEFGNLAEALAAVLNGNAPARPVATKVVPIGQRSAVVTELAARRKAPIRRLGSAA